MDKKTIIVVGAGQGLGNHVAERFGREGYRVDRGGVQPNGGEGGQVYRRPRGREKHHRLPQPGGAPGQSGEAPEGVHDGDHK